MIKNEDNIIAHPDASLLSSSDKPLSPAHQARDRAQVMDAPPQSDLHDPHDPLDPLDRHHGPEAGSPSSSWPLQACVFQGDLSTLSAQMRASSDKASLVRTADPHGNTALHLAVMLGKKEMVHLLLAHAAPVKIKNKLGWSPLAEAISYGDRQTISILLRKLKSQAKEQLKTRKPDMIAALKKLGDYVVDLRWDFTSWIPLVSKMLPSDICKISKKGEHAFWISRLMRSLLTTSHPCPCLGACVRLDTTLVDFTEMHWERGDITFLYRGDASSPDVSLFVLDNKLKVYQRVRTEESEMEFEEEVDLLMSGDIISAQISTKPINFTKAQSGWFFKEDRHEMVGTYNATFYSINGISLETRKRREHLSNEDLQKNKALLENFAKGNVRNTLAKNPSLPAQTEVSWKDYIEAPPGQFPNLGRKQLCKESSKAFKATVAMSEDFPLTIIAPQFKHFQKLRDFVEMKLPPGFPVKVDIPVLPTVSARVTFQDFAWDDKLEDSLFEIPKGYVEDPTRFPDL
ncbi:hypothetical protein TCAL_07385 [Tigriopus californicus]|uniref:Ankyrin repeat domain-containing protein n=1 Tax=Tigriopus californicus TaxID=6832 RepID=A0A553PCX6_TIGCA|nr:hypothetical protein TCAL_07385 [Tigriopus californicus]